MDSTDILKISANRAAEKYPLRVMTLRVLWIFGAALFRWSPRPCFAWRRMLLRCFGAKVGRQVHLYPSTRVYFPWNLKIGDWSAVGEDALLYNLGPITIGKNVTISHRAHLCAGTHDYTKSDFPLLKPPIQINDQAWVCTDAFIGPEVHIGEGAIVAARAVVTKNVDSWSIVGGNPARWIKTRELHSL
jgi:putative colanic acid biosynthesis acetyltransferase WcaF